MELRLAKGIDVQRMLNRYGVDLWARFGRDLQLFLEQGLLVYDGARLRLSRRGMLLANEVMTVFVSPTVR